MKKVFRAGWVIGFSVLLTAVAGAEVVAYETEYHYANGRTQAKILDKKQTDTDGSVLLEIEPSYSLETVFAAKKEGLSMGWFSVGRRTAKGMVTIKLGEPSILGGSVVDEEGNPIAGAVVRGDVRGGYQEQAGGVSPRMVESADGQQGEIPFRQYP